MIETRRLKYVILSKQFEALCCQEKSYVCMNYLFVINKK